MEINWWSRHFQSVWAERAADESLPLWLRVTCLAYGGHRANGHANFHRGELARLLRVPADTNLYRAIRNARNRGWIDLESTSRCLIVPAHAVAGGDGHANEVCAIHDGKRTGRRKPKVIGSTATRIGVTQ